MLPNHHQKVRLRVRFLNLVIDSIPIYLITWFIFGLVYNIYFTIIIQSPYDDISTFWPPHVSREGKLFIGCFLFAQFIYYSTMEWLFSLTIGKLITRTRVKSITGDKAVLSQIIIRSLIRSLPIVNIFDWHSYLKPNGIGLHDKWPDTIVISARDITK